MGNQELADRLHLTQKRLNTVKRWLSRENPRTRYRLVTPKTSPQGATQENDTALVNSVASVIADAMLGDPDAVQLVTRSNGDGLEPEKTWTLMTKLGRVEKLHQHTTAAIFPPACVSKTLT